MRYRFKEYSNLRRAVGAVLAQHGYGGRYKAGTLANVLLDAFVTDQAGKITSQTLQDAGVIQRGDYDIWRKAMVQMDILHWDMNQDGFNQFRAGPVIRKYLEREMQHRTALDVVYIIEYYDPPYSDEKRDKALEMGRKALKRT